MTDSVGHVFTSSGRRAVNGSESLRDPADTPRPTWSLAGSVLETAAGAIANLDHSPWTSNPEGWASNVTLSGASGVTAPRRTAQLLVTHALPEGVAPALARTLIAFRVRALGPEPEHLGDIYVR